VAIAVLSGPASRAALEPHADYVLDDISGLPGLIGRLNG
jgi:phosphoglycolate phosphatase-like HAD superfamily hydrolase